MRHLARANTKFWKCAISDMVLTRARLLLATLWVGSLWTIGYIVAPTLLGTIEDTSLAERVTGSLFQVQAWISMVCGVLLLILVARAKQVFDARQHRHLLLLMAGMVLGAVVTQFGIQPYLAQLDAVGLAVVDVRARVRQLQDVSSAIYMLQSVLGVLLIFKLYHAK